jgi:hypothetical protein
MPIDKGYRIPTGKRCPRLLPRLDVTGDECRP